MGSDETWRIGPAPEGATIEPVYYDGPPGCGNEVEPGLVCGPKLGFCYSCVKAWRERAFTADDATKNPGPFVLRPETWATEKVDDIVPMSTWGEKRTLSGVALRSIVERAIRETIEKCAEVCDAAGGENDWMYCEDIRKLGQP